mgnify:CR=1 FL=1
MHRELIKQLNEIVQDVYALFELNIPKDSYYSAICYLIDRVLNSLDFTAFEAIAILETVKMNIAYRELSTWYAKHKRLIKKGDFDEG